MGSELLASLLRPNGLNNIAKKQISARMWYKVMLEIITFMIETLMPRVLFVTLVLSLAGCYSPERKQARTPYKPCPYQHNPGLEFSSKLFPFIDRMENREFYLGMSLADVEKKCGKELQMTNEVAANGEVEGYVSLHVIHNNYGQPRKDGWVARFIFNKDKKLTLYYVSNECRWK